MTKSSSNASKVTVAQILQKARGQMTMRVTSQPSTKGPASSATGTPSTVRHSVRHSVRRRTPGGSVRVRPGGFEGADIATECGMTVPIGPAVIDLLTLLYHSNTPALLIGTHGVGKSEIVAAAAKMIGIECISRDLSLMEPPDLVGLPKIENNATTYFPPDFLPREDTRQGFLVFEEINRSPRYMQAACLELLTSRRLNGYALPKGFLPVACINPKTDGYFVDVLDSALMSRFSKIHVCAAVEPWSAWAIENGIHPAVINYVQTVPDALDELRGGSNPRSWTFASKILTAATAEMLGRNPDAVVTALNGVIGPVHTTALLRMFMGTEMPLKPTDVIHNWPTSRATMRRWAQQGRLDLLGASMRSILQWVRPEGVAEQLRANARDRNCVRGFIRTLSGDLSEQARSVLLELGYDFLIPGDSADGQAGGRPAK